MLVKYFRTCCVAALAAAAVAVAGCGGSEQAPAATAPPPNAKRVDPSKAGNVTGRVLFEGTPPPNEPIRMTSDPVCTRENPGGVNADTVLVNDGGLENVFVYVKDGLGGYYFDVPTDPVTLDQKGCRYSPHLIGLRVGQPLEIVNSDATMHNVHALPTVNREFNFSQIMAGMKDRKVFTAREVMVRFKCDVHTWMSAYAGVLDHPYFAVTANGGKFELKGLPAGTYTVEAWHEKLGTATQSVTLGEKENREITFAFKGAATN
jgi:plastocyanin